MAISVHEQQLLAAFPRPPASVSSSSPPPNSAGEPSPRLYRPSDFGFITVGHKAVNNRDSGSLYDDPANDDEQTYGMASFAPGPVHLPSSVGSSGIQLVLDNPSKLYAPLETITGYVTGCDRSSSPPTHLHIILEGRAKSYFHDANFEYADRAPLVYQTTHIKPGKGNNIPRFSVPIPERTSSGLEKLNELGPKDAFTNKPYWTNNWPSKDPYESQPGHPLPPSMIMRLRSASPLARHPSGHGYIEYKLIAIRSHLDPETGKLNSEAACQVPIWITTRRLPRSHLSELQRQTSSATTNLSISTSQLLKSRQLTLREQFRDALNASLPSFYFTTTTTVPKLSTPGSDLKISIAVSVTTPPAGKLYNFPIPDISITSLNIIVRSYTGLRIFRPSLLDSTKPLQLKSHTFKAIEHQTSKALLPSAKFTPRNGSYESQSCVVTTALPNTILPSYRTYNFWRSYRLECDVRFKVAGKEVEACSRSDLNVVARGSGSVGDLAPGLCVQADVENEVATLEMARTVVGMEGLRGDLIEVVDG